MSRRLEDEFASLAEILRRLPSELSRELDKSIQRESAATLRLAQATCPHTYIDFSPVDHDGNGIRVSSTFRPRLSADVCRACGLRVSDYKPLKGES